MEVLLRLSLLMGLLGATGLVLMPGTAMASPVIDVVFTGSSGSGTPGSPSIVASPGDVLTAEIRLAAGSAGVSSYGLSLRFDEDLGNELDLEGPPTELLPDGYGFNFNEGVEETQESTASAAGYVRTFEAATFDEGPADESFAIGTVDFVVNGALEADGADIRVGLFNTGVDGLFDNEENNLEASATFNGAAVNPVPEPTTGLLLASGLGGLGLAGRRGRRSR